MSIDFTTLKSLTVPEGVVTQIADMSGNVLWSAKQSGIQPTKYLTFSANSPFTLSVETPGWDGTMYYSLNTTEWIEWDGSAISSTTIYLCGKDNTKVTGERKTLYKWTLVGTNISCSGNIETLLDFETVKSGKHPAMAEHCYSLMFVNCTSLTTAPELPATTLAYGCYYGTFQGCTRLTTAPELPATTLYNSCYYGMFYGCTRLTTAPELPATTLYNSCYRDMFYGCIRLTTVPTLPAITLAQYCYCNMFYGCSSIKLSTTKTDEYTTAYRIPKSGIGTTATKALYNMFYNTGGTFTGTPSINTTYYLHSSNSVV